MPTNADEPMFDLRLNGAHISIDGMPELVTDIAINYDWPLERRDPRIAELGDLREKPAHEYIDAGSLWLHLDAGQAIARMQPARLTFRKGVDRGSDVAFELIHSDS